jgi:hypothetical protein
MAGMDIVGDDLIGAEDDIIGDDDLVGAAPRRARLVRKPYTERRKEILPLGSTTIAAGATEIVTVRPQRPFRVERLTLTASAPGALLVDFRVGATPQFVSAGAVPVEVFGPTATDNVLHGDTASVGMDITIVIVNPTAAPIDVAGAIVGTAAQ